MRIVHVVPTLCNGGIERFLINLISGLPKWWKNEVVVYDERNDWSEELSKLGVLVKTMRAPARVGIFRNMRGLYCYFKQKKPDVVYAYTYYNAAYVLAAAALAGVKIRVVHAHTLETEHSKTLLYVAYVLFSKMLLAAVATCRLACSTETGKKLFYGKFKVIKNGVRVENYLFDRRKRSLLRKQLGIAANTVVLGAVGWLNKNKNQEMMIKVLAEYIKLCQDTRLVLVGDGPELERLVGLARQLGVFDKVLFVGSIKNASDYYNVFDVFLLTSYHEGFPYVLVEAQMNGLPTLVSSTVTKEVKLSDNMRFADLELGPRCWAEMVEAMPKSRVKLGAEILGYSLQKTIDEVKRILEGGKVC